MRGSLGRGTSALRGVSLLETEGRLGFSLHDSPLAGIVGSPPRLPPSFIPESYRGSFRFPIENADVRS